MVVNPWAAAEPVRREEKNLPQRHKGDEQKWKMEYGK
jgi:hypothetical protein